MSNLLGPVPQTSLLQDYLRPKRSKGSRRLWRNPQGGSPDHRVPRQSWAYPLPPWSQRFGRLRSTSSDSSRVSFPLLFSSLAKEFRELFREKPANSRAVMKASLVKDYFSIAYAWCSNCTLPPIDGHTESCQC